MPDQKDLLTVEYDLTRRDVWGWRWTAMRRPIGTWIVHLLGAAAVFEFMLLCLTMGRGFTLAGVVASLAAAGVVLIVWIGLPIVRFRPQARSLRIDRAGIQIVVDGVRRFKSWGQVAAILDRNGPIYFVNPRMNAIIVPVAAFSGPDRRQAFLRQVRCFHAAHHREAAQVKPRSAAS